MGNRGHLPTVPIKEAKSAPALSASTQKPVISTPWVIAGNPTIPLDKEAIFNSVKKTSKVLIVHEDKVFSGFGAEIAGIIGSELFQYLDAPIQRVGSYSLRLVSIRSWNGPSPQRGDHLSCGKRTAALLDPHSLNL